MRKKIADRFHEVIGWLLKTGDFKPFYRPVEIIITANFKDKRLHDPDNLCSKVIIDPLVTHGILKDDNWQYVKSVTTKVVVGTEDKIILEVI
ncbi:MAG: hypothetical protein D6822_04540 [Cyanobacteria bacterium J149]|nr:MAG: hypothetical protein D6822_04540 [Cyanobacteria bacterium J149]